METQIFHHAKKILIFKTILSKIQNPSRYYYHNSIITNLKFQHKLGKMSSFKNPSIKNRPIIV